MSAQTLSRQTLEEHNECLSSPRKPGTVTNKHHPNTKHGLLDPQVARLIQDNRKSKTGLKNEKAGSVHSSQADQSNRSDHSLNSLVRLRPNKLPRWKASKFSSVSMHSKKGLQISLENNYMMEPKTTSKFNTDLTKSTVEDVLKEHLDSEAEYSPSRGASLSRILAEEIKRRVKMLGFTRYKIVAHVMIGQNCKQGLHMASRCVWDTSTDNMVPTVYQSGDIFAVATVFGTYYE